MIQYPNLFANLKYIGANQMRVRKTARSSMKSNFQFMKALCNHLINNPDQMIVPVYSFEVLEDDNRNQFRYSYDMMAMGMLSREDKDIVNLISCRVDHYGQTPDDPDPNIRSCWDRRPELMCFLDKLVRMNRYFDLHDGNIMIDHEENYKVIDLEGFIRYPLSDRHNDWITRNETT